jgi:hypothetical protein
MFPRCFDAVLVAAGVEHAESLASSEADRVCGATISTIRRECLDRMLMFKRAATRPIPAYAYSGGKGAQRLL